MQFSMILPQFSEKLSLSYDNIFQHEANDTQFNFLEDTTYAIG